MEWEGVFGMGGGVWNGRECLEKNSTAVEFEKKFHCYEKKKWSLEKNPLLWMKIVEFGKIVVVEFIDMSGVNI